MSTRLNSCNAEQMDLIKEQQDWTHRGVGVHRGVASADILGFNVDEDTAPRMHGKHMMSEVSASHQAQSILKAELSLMHCNLNPQIPVGDLWSQVSGVVDALPNVDPMQDDKWKRLIGNVYQHGNYCEFLVSLYNVEQHGDHVLDFKRMSGDGFVMDQFFRAVKSNMRKQEALVMDDTDDEEDSEVFDAYSSDEEDGETDDQTSEYLRPHAFLQLSYDENLVQLWINKIKTRHVEDQNHMMGLLAYNSQNAENLEIIHRKGGDDLVQLCKQLLEESNSAALVRNTSVLVNRLTSIVDLWSAEFIVAIFCALEYWVPNNDRSSESNRKTFEVTESRETVMNLVEALFSMRKSVSEEHIAKCASDLQPDKRMPIVSYLESRDASAARDFVLGVFPQA